MNAWKTGALAAVLAAAAGVGAALAPVAHGQTQTVVTPKKSSVLQMVTSGGRLGVSVRDVSDDEIKRHRLQGGVIVDEVSNESAAQKAGFKTGDIVVEYDGERVRSVRQFTRLVQESPSGRTVPAVVLRDGQRTTLNVEPRDSDYLMGLRNLDVFRNLDDTLRYAIPRAPTPPRPPALPRTPLLREFEGFAYRFGTSTLGVTVSDLSGQLADYFGVKDGLLVTAVTADSPAARAGVKAGDVITSVNGTTVDDTGDIRAAMQNVKPGAEFSIEVMRDRKSMTLKGKTEERPTPRRRVVV